MAELLENEALPYFATYATVILLKMTLMTGLVGYRRVSRGVFANQEDVDSLGPKGKDKKPVFDDEGVERARRCHLNDIESIVPFFALGLLYPAFSGAALTTVIWHYRVFVAARLLHTVIYLNAVPQPTRAIAAFVGVSVNVSMAIQILLKNCPLEFY